MSSIRQGTIVRMLTGVLLLVTLGALASPLAAGSFADQATAIAAFFAHRPDVRDNISRWSGRSEPEWILQEWLKITTEANADTEMARRILAGPYPLDLPGLGAEVPPVAPVPAAPPPIESAPPVNPPAPPPTVPPPAEPSPPIAAPPAPGGNQDGFPEAADRFWGISPTASHRLDDLDLRALKDLGVRTIRVNYQQAHPLDDYLRVADICRQNGIDVMMLVCYEAYAGQTVEEPTPWGGKRLRYLNPLDLVGVLRRIVPPLSARGVKSWEIWNEENGSWYVEPGEYAKLLAAVYDGFKFTERWDPEATIVFGGLDTTCWECPDGVNGAARDYLAAVYAAPGFADYRRQRGRYPFDVMATHPYGAETKEKFDNSIARGHLAVMRNHGDGNKPVWITELGDANPDDAVQAQKVRHFATVARQNPAVARFYLFKLCYPGGEGHAHYSIMRQDGHRRAAFETYRQVIAGGR